MHAIVRSLGDAPAPAVVRALRDAATEHVGGRFADDLCILAARARAGD